LIFHPPLAPAFFPYTTLFRSQLLVGERAVDVGRIEEVDAELERAMDGGDGLGVIAAAVEVGHAHAAEPHGRHDEAVGPEGTLLQDRKSTRLNSSHEWISYAVF